RRGPGRVAARGVRPGAGVRHHDPGRPRLPRLPVRPAPPVRRRVRGDLGRRRLRRPDRVLRRPRPNRRRGPLPRLARDGVRRAAVAGVAGGARRDRGRRGGVHRHADGPVLGRGGDAAVVGGRPVGPAGGLPAAPGAGAVVRRVVGGGAGGLRPGVGRGADVDGVEPVADGVVPRAGVPQAGRVAADGGGGGGGGPAEPAGG